MLTNYVIWSCLSRALTKNSVVPKKKPFLFRVFFRSALRVNGLMANIVQVLHEKARSPQYYYTLYFVSDNTKMINNSKPNRGSKSDDCQIQNIKRSFWVLCWTFTLTEGLTFGKSCSTCLAYLIFTVYIYNVPSCLFPWHSCRQTAPPW